MPRKKEIDKQIWQEALVSVRDKYKDRIEKWFLRLDVLLSGAEGGTKIDKNEVEAIKLGFRFFDALKEKETITYQSARKKTEKPELKPALKKELEKILNG